MAETLFIHPIQVQDAEWGGLQPQNMTLECHFATHYPYFSDCGAHYQRPKGVSAHPYPHPQHMKVLKHYLYI
jgi:hypothetical protein